ncbi:uncharacterized protein K02A2.6-like [Culex pipiens pallens]|uniref:uncharacterized protein K02A2.6-like n=1 Tax=Culex pipiens pallens TaxID=42434 RepID=UPI0022AB1324|nr:uncharacterized protein K02A2.6-like [Culex pipiens pallens]
MAELQQAILKITELLQKMAAPAAAPDNSEQILESLATNISEFSFDEENGVTFDKWFRRYEDMFKEDASKLKEEAKVRLLLRKLDTTAHSRYCNYILPKLPSAVKFDDTVATLRKIFGSHTSIFHKRYQCLQLAKSEAEDIITYGGKVNRACEDFEFQKVKIDQFKCLIFICGLKSPRYADVRARLLSRIEAETAENPVTLQTLIDEFQRLVNLKADTTLVERPSSSKPAVHAVQEKRSGPQQQRPAKTEGKLPRTPCWQCGQMHFVRDCPFSGHLCKACNRVGHKEGYCSCVSKPSSSSSKPDHSVEEKKKQAKKQQKAKSRGIFVNHVAANRSRRKYLPITINGVATQLQLDTASDITVVAKATWRKLGQPCLQPSSIQAINASGQPLGLVGEFVCDVTLNGRTERSRCFVTSSPGLNLLGIEWIELFELWSVPIDSICNVVEVKSVEEQLQELRANHAAVFDDSLGHCTKTKVKLYLKPNAKPVFCPKRPVPFNTISLVDDELNRLQSLGIITPVEFSEWAAPIVAVRKPNGRVRICADFSTGLNEALEANHYPLPTPEEIFAQLSGSSIFSIIDLSDAYLQLEVDDDSKKLLTINTHRGLFQYNRLTPGVKSAPGAYQSLLDGMIAGIPGVRTFMDDVIVFGPDRKSHASSLKQLLQRLKEYGFHVKAEKCSFFQLQIRYLGHIVDSRGIRPDPEKLRTIAAIPAPTNVSELRSFLGAVNFYGRFVRNLHELRRPMDQLLKKDTKWRWTSECQQAFEKFKEVLQSSLLLTHYNPKLPIIVAADASSTGIGAVILHQFPDGSLKAVQHASRSLTPAERNYGQPEKEALALVYAVTKFHKYLLGRPFTLQTDHKPLLSIFGSKKGIPLHTANRLQRWPLTMLNYDFEIQHVSTNDFGCADMLSRLIDRTIQPEEEYVVAALTLEEDLASIISDTIDKVPVSFAALQKATATNATLQAVVKYIRDGWPSSAESVTNSEVLPYFRRRESLSLVDGCVMFHDRVVVPNQFRSQILRQFHRGHPGMVRMKAIARSFVYWPGLDNEIEDFVKRCNPCSIAGKAPTKTCLESWPTPSKPWSRIHIDYAGPVDGVYFLVVVDPFTKWPEVYATRTMTAKTTIKLLTQSFATFGIPEVIVSDNGTQFTGHEFKEFCTKLGIRHLRTAPFHPQSNGSAERFVDTLKRSLRKIRAGGETLEEALQTLLQVYRSTPTSDLDGKSPAEVMFGRPVRTISALLQPTKDNSPSTSARAEKQNDAFNKKHGAIQRIFKHGDAVFAQVHRANSWQWEAGTVIEKIGRVNYNIFLDDRRRLIRSHANQLKRRVPETTASPEPTSLSIFFDGFGLADAVAAPVPATPVPVPVPVDDSDPEFSDDDSEESDDQEQSGSSEAEFEDAAVEPPAPAALPAERASGGQGHPVPEAPQGAPAGGGRGQRAIKLPGRFSNFWMK